MVGAVVLSLCVAAAALAQAPGDSTSKLILVHPPAASARKALSDLFPSSRTLGDIARKLGDSLSQAEYDDQGWFLVSSETPGPRPSQPNVIGFAVVTKLEQINDDGTPKPGNRWVLDMSPPDVGSFMDAIKLLLKGAPNGRYRVFMIWVSNDPVSQMPSDVPLENWQKFVREGTKAPFLSVLDNIRVNYGARGGATAFVYEYVRSAISGETQFVPSSALTVPDHLKKSGIWSALFEGGQKEGHPQ